MHNMVEAVVAGNKISEGGNDEEEHDVDTQ